MLFNYKVSGYRLLYTYMNNRTAPCVLIEYTCIALIVNRTLEGKSKEKEEFDSGKENKPEGICESKERKEK